MGDDIVAGGTPLGAAAEIALATLDETLKIRPRVAAAAVRQLIEGFVAG